MIQTEKVLPMRDPFSSDHFRTKKCSCRIMRFLLLFWKTLLSFVNGLCVLCGFRLPQRRRSLAEKNEELHTAVAIGLIQVSQLLSPVARQLRSQHPDTEPSRYRENELPHSLLRNHQTFSAQLEPRTYLPWL